MAQDTGGNNSAQTLVDIIRAYIIDNTIGAVNPAKLRTVLEAIANSVTASSGTAISATPPLNFDAFTNVFSIDKAELNEYSTTETVVGTWIDGKPIYCKVVVLPAGSLFVNTSNQVVNIPNLKRLLPTSNYSFYRNFGSDEVLTNPFYTSSTGSTPATFTNVDYINLSQLGSDIKLRVFGLSTSSGTYESTFILFYTKTTD